MIFPHTYQKVIEGQQTTTRRKVNARDVALVSDIGFIKRVFIDEGCYEGHTIFCVGHYYYVHRDQAAKQEICNHRIKITQIAKEDVRQISENAARREGFANRIEFWQSWCERYDPRISIEASADGAIVRLKGDALWEDEKGVARLLESLPDGCYQAWVLTFELEE